MTRLLEGIEFKATSLERGGAEELVLLYLDLSMQVKKKGLEAIEPWMNRFERPVPIKEAMEGVYLGITGDEIRERHRKEIIENKIFGTELLELLVAGEGAALIADGESPSYIYEYLASLFGEEYSEEFQANIRNLYHRWA